MSNSLQLGITVSVAVLVLYIFIVWLAWRFQEKLLFFPEGPEFPECPGLSELKGQAIHAEHNGQEIRGFYFPQTNANKTIILFHGNGGNACDRINYVQGLQEVPVNVLLAEYPGYAGSSDELSEANFIANATSLVHWWQANDGKEQELVFFGESLGTGIAVYLATQFPAELLILHTPYDSIAAVAKHHYPWLPISSLLRHKFDSGRWIRKVKSPVLVLHGGDDSIIPIRHAESLYSFIPKSVEKRFERFPGRDHNNLWVSNAPYWNALEEVLLQGLSK